MRNRWLFAVSWGYPSRTSLSINRLPTLSAGGCTPLERIGPGRRTRDPEGVHPFPPIAGWPGSQPPAHRHTDQTLFLPKHSPPLIAADLVSSAHHHGLPGQRQTMVSWPPVHDREEPKKDYIIFQTSTAVKGRLRRTQQDRRPCPRSRRAHPPPVRAP